MRNNDPAPITYAEWEDAQAEIDRLRKELKQLQEHELATSNFRQQFAEENDRLRAENEKLRTEKANLNKVIHNLAVAINELFDRRNLKVETHEQAGVSDGNLGGSGGGGSAGGDTCGGGGGSDRGDLG